MATSIGHSWLVAVTAALLISATGCSSVVDLIAAAAPWRRHTIDDSLDGADGVRLADVNGDGLLDIATGWEEAGRVRAYINPGPAHVDSPWPTVTVGQVGSPEDAVFVDLDGDGAVDVVSCTEGRTRTVWVHWAPTSPGDYLDRNAWETAAITATADRRQWMFALPFDVDGTNGTDLVVGAKEDNAAIGWLESPTDARDVGAWRWHELYAAGWIMSLRAHDVDGDGDLDVVASDRKGGKRGCLWLANPGPGQAATAAWPEHRIGPGDVPVMFLDVADLDRDGLDDIVAAVSDNYLLFHRRKSVEPVDWQTYRIDFPSGVGTGKGVAVGDIDMDSRNDIVVTCESAGDDRVGVFWLSYDEDPTDTRWNAHNISGARGVKFDRVELLDLDADGDLDVITCEERTGLGIVWYENPTVQ